MTLTTIIAAALLNGRPGALLVRFAGFYGDRLFANNTREALMDCSYDISSLMARKRDELLQVLRRASPDSDLRPVRDYRLLVRSGKEEWMMDANGRLLYRNRLYRLSKPQLLDIKHLIYESLPPPSETLNWWDELFGKGR